MATTLHTHRKPEVQHCLLLLHVMFLPSLSADFPSEASLLLPHTGDQFVLPTGIHIFLIAGTASSRTPQPLLTSHPQSNPPSPLYNRPSTSPPSDPPPKCSWISSQPPLHGQQTNNHSKNTTQPFEKTHTTTHACPHSFAYTNTQLSSCSWEIYSVWAVKLCRSLRLFSKGVPSLCGKIWRGKNKRTQKWEEGEEKKQKFNQQGSRWGREAF